MKSVVIIGGGVGGLFTANKLASKLSAEIRRGEVSVTVVEPQDRQVYQPGFLYVPFKELTPDVMFKPVSKLVSPLVKVEREPAAKIDLSAKKIVLQSGKELKYDYLIVATGAVVKTGSYPGFGEAWHTLWTYEGAKRLREALRRFNGGTIVVSVTSTPYKCPVAPYEFLGLLNDYLMATGLRAKTKVIFTTVAPHLHAQPQVNKFLEEIMRMWGFDYKTKFQVNAIEPGKISGPEEIKADLIMAVPPHGGSEVVTKSGIGDQAGWVPVDRHTLQIQAQGATGAEYAIGDATNLPVPKAGSVAHFQSEIVSSRIAEEIQLGYSDTEYDGRVICFILTGFEEATVVSWNYENPAKYPPPPSRFFNRLKDMTNYSIWSVMRCGL
ncbi:NAD(P)/FAD-dependent oxidoreductase [Pyrobaculum aerophilum]|uniref:Flavoprotein reductase, conjectural n=2 Tax=Pyrobaculum aerophilum TaxID=13773 RepID=Q8ZUT5_PYRAE|nr:MULTISPECIES: FAD/NAD(P)-binding oxidoreductase [Pyrobaculum]AAL64321.1 flavoprotein reductase, conjectural [Pyrobaculum aerophilum str. IM2]MCX8137197.1 NAD(P)/FAD-dependent oxidoreductase [Pyrobaculum aerophilum]HII47937.1 NAD(P)/FAD-dependent oxidoreductase [Pyrobaculum aerophilum]